MTGQTTFCREFDDRCTNFECESGLALGSECRVRPNGDCFDPLKRWQMLVYQTRLVSVLDN
jgi:hypothetical protein